MQTKLMMLQMSLTQLIQGGRRKSIRMHCMQMAQTRIYQFCRLYVGVMDLSHCLLRKVRLLVTFHSVKYVYYYMYIYYYVCIIIILNKLRFLSSNSLFHYNLQVIVVVPGQKKSLLPRHHLVVKCSKTHMSQQLDALVLLMNRWKNDLTQKCFNCGLDLIMCSSANYMESTCAFMWSYSFHYRTSLKNDRVSMLLCAAACRPQGGDIPLI